MVGIAQIIILFILLILIASGVFGIYLLYSVASGSDKDKTRSKIRLIGITAVNTLVFIISAVNGTELITWSIPRTIVIVFFYMIMIHYYIIKLVIAGTSEEA